MKANEVLEVLRGISNRPEPSTEEEAKIQAYQDWALGEIFYRFTDAPNTEAEDILFWFETEMHAYEGMVDDEIDPFLVAIDVADTILALLEYPRED